MRLGAHLGQVGGVQVHSLGPLMPWTIVASNDSVYALNGETGEKGTEYPYNQFGVGYGVEGSFKYAYAQAEIDALERKGDMELAKVYEIALVRHVYEDNLNHFFPQVA